MFNFFSKKKTSKTIGIQITQQLVSLAVVDRSDAQHPILIDFVQYEIEQGRVSTDIQKKIYAYIEAEQLKYAACCLVLDNKDYQVLVLEAPNVPADEMAEAVKWKVKDLIPYSLEEAIVDVFLQPDTALSSTRIANVVATKKSLVDERISLIAAMGLDVVAIDIPELSYRNYYEYSNLSRQPMALITIHKGYSKLSVIHNDSVCFSRSFPVSYSAGLLEDIPESDIVLELQRSLDYYERQLKQVIPNTVIYTGENLTSDKITNITKDGLNQRVVFQENVLINCADHIVNVDELLGPQGISSLGGALRKDLMRLQA